MPDANSAVGLAVQVNGLALPSTLWVAPRARVHSTGGSTTYLLRVIDGDTFVTSGSQSVRLFGVDTPERGEKCYREATARLRQLAGDEVRVELGPRSKDRYGRLLYYVYTQDGGSIDEILVSEGLAKAWTRDGQHRDLLVSLERDAVGC